MRWLSYLLLALRRLASWRSPAAFIEWKLGLLLLMMEAIPVVAVTHWILDFYVVSVNRRALALLVVVPFVFLNQRILARYPPGKHAHDFEALPRAHRVAVYVAAALLVALTFALPFIVHRLEFGYL